MAEGIPDEAVEAFLRAHASTVSQFPIAIDGYIEAAREAPMWEKTRAGLEAAAPLIVARTLEDAATTITIHARRYDDATATADERNVAHGLRVAAHLLRDPTAARIARGPGPVTAGTTEPPAGNDAAFVRGDLDHLYGWGGTNEHCPDGSHGCCP